MKNTLQLVESKPYMHSENIRNKGLKSSLTYCKLENKDVINENKLLKSRLLEGGTT